MSALLAADHGEIMNLDSDLAHMSLILNRIGERPKSLVYKFGKHTKLITPSVSPITNYV
jgi:hypothetical protein